MLTIFAKPIFKNYFVEACSLSFVVFGFLIIFVLIFPFLAAFASEKFWIREDVLYETPLIDFKNELFMYVYDKNDKVYFYSTNTKINSNYNSIINSPKISYTLFDTNYDNIIEKIAYKINFNADPNEIRGIKLLLSLDYAFANKVKLLMDGIINVDMITPEGFKYLKVIGDVEFKQKSPIFQG